MHKGSEYDLSDCVAVIGYALRFPGAATPEVFWSNLLQGRDSLTRFDKEKLIALGFDTGLISRKDYVAVRGILPDIDRFDAAFFGLTAAEAELADPQLRLMLEVAWECFERSGLLPRTLSGPCGVFVAKAISKYMLNVLRPETYDVEQRATIDIGTVNEVDAAATQLAYRLNLTGPAVAVQTFCSSSLTAVHMSVQSLLNMECDFAIAGGAFIDIPQERGYLYEQGGFTSPDGCCRAFDASAAGTPFGNGVGMVLLRRLKDAIEADDPIAAVIRGSAVTNDGGQKAGYHAPSLSGVESAVRQAIDVANIKPSEVSYIEMHGTGTPLGDPIELAGVGRGLDRESGVKEPIWIGSLKPNIGHLDRASGVASLLKAILAVRFGEIPPTINYRRPNPELGLESLGFVVPTNVVDWHAPPWSRIAGVNAMGIGGTNVHVVLSGWQDSRVSSASVGPFFIPISSRSERNLRIVAEQLLEWIKRTNEIELADLAYTLQVGRTSFEFRVAFSVGTLSELCEHLQTYIETGVRPQGSPSEGWVLASRWVAGEDISWLALHSQKAKRRRVDAPTYPFDRQRHWYDKNGSQPNTYGQFYSEVVYPDLRLNRQNDSHIVTFHGEQLPECHSDISVEGNGAPPTRSLVYLVPSKWRLQEILVDLAALSKEQLQSDVPVRRILIATRDSHPINGATTPNPTMRAAEAFARCMSIEMPDIEWRFVDFSMELSCTEVALLLRDELKRPSADGLSIRLGVGSGHIIQLAPVSLSVQDGQRLFSSGVILLGGFGGIGPTLGRWCSSQGATRVIIVGRTLKAEIVANLSQEGINCRGFACNLTDPRAVSDLIASLADEGEIDTVFHLAAEIDDRLSFSIGKSVNSSVLDTKILGLEHGKEIAARTKARSLVVFSSLASVVGNSGQSEYAAANAYMDATVDGDQEEIRVVAINWCPWADIGFAATTLQKNSLVQSDARRLDRASLESTQALRCLGDVLANDRLRRISISPILPTTIHRVENRAVTSQAPLKDIRELFASVWRKHLPVEAEIGDDTHFFRVGGHSLSALKVVAEISQALDVNLPPSLLFLHPTFGAATEALENGGRQSLNGGGQSPRENLAMQWDALPIKLPNGLVILGRSQGEAEHIYASIFEEEVYLQSGITLPNHPVVVDVGMNIGLFAMHIMQERPFATIYAFEPSKALFQIAQKNLERYGRAIQSFNVGLYSVEGEMPFHYFPNSPAYSSFVEVGEYEKGLFRHHMHRAIAGGASAKLEEISDILIEQRMQVEVSFERVSTLSTFIRDLNLNVIDLLKIDVQGVELDVLRGIDPDHWHLIRQIACEVHDQGNRLQTVRDLLIGLGFEVNIEQEVGYIGTDIYMVYARRS